MKLSYIILLIFAIIGLLATSIAIHEGYHYVDLKINHNVTIINLCALAIPISDNNYSDVGYVEYRPKVDLDEVKPKIMEISFVLIICLIWIVIRFNEK